MNNNEQGEKLRLFSAMIEGLTGGEQVTFAQHNDSQEWMCGDHRPWADPMHIHTTNHPTPEVAAGQYIVDFFIQLPRLMLKPATELTMQEDRLRQNYFSRLKLVTRCPYCGDKYVGSTSISEAHNRCREAFEKRERVRRDGPDELREYREMCREGRKP